MSDTCVKQIQDACAPKTLHQGTEEGHSQKFSLCLPFGGELFSEGGFVNYKPGTPPPDGVYTSLTIKDGCIVAVGFADIATYTATPCAPVPNPCDCTGSGGGDTPISPAAGNLTTRDASGLLTTLHTAAGSGVSVAGRGTVTDPLTISVDQQSVNVPVQSGNAAIIVDGAGTAEAPYKISHLTQASSGQSYAGFSFDKFGHMIDYTAPIPSGSITAVTDGPGIFVQTDLETRIANVSLAEPLHLMEGDYQFGAWFVEIDELNRVYRITRVFTFPAGTYRFGRYDVTIDEYGNVTEVAKLSAVSVFNSATRHLSSAQNNISFSFVTTEDSCFRVNIDSTEVPADTNVYIDGMALVGRRMGTIRYCAFSDVVWAAGQHTVQVTGSNFPVGTFIEVSLTTVV